MEYLDFDCTYDLKAKHDPDEDKVLKDGEFIGMAAVFNNVDFGFDKILPGAFKRNLKRKGKKRTLLFSHDVTEPIGVGEFEEVEEGLKVFGMLNMDVQNAKDKFSLMKQGAINGLSIGFETVSKEFENAVRILKEIKLMETSLVVFPMNDKARVMRTKSLTGEFSTRDLSILIMSHVNESKGKQLVDGDESLILKALESLKALLPVQDKTEEPDGEQSDQTIVVPSSPLDNLLVELAEFKGRSPELDILSEIRLFKKEQLCLNQQS